MKLLPLVILTAAAGFAQLAPSTGAQGTGSTPAVQLPLSGRTGLGGSVAVQQSPLPGVGSSVNTINSTLQIQGPFTGSVPAGATPAALTFREAIRRGLEYNLGAIGSGSALRQARGQRTSARSQLLPNLNANLRETVQQTNLRALGFRLNTPIPGLQIPTVVGPFNYFDLRATLTQTIADLTTLNNYRAAEESARAAEHAVQDARDLVVYAVAGAYLQVEASVARVDTARAQVATAEALLKQSRERLQVGFNARIDVNRSQVQLQTQQQRLTSLENDLAKQRLNLSRLIGLAPGEPFELADHIPYSPAPDLPFESALRRALQTRADLQAADAQIRAAERARSAAKAERLPSLAFNADYGAIGINPAQSHGTFTVTGNLRIPIWQGGRAEGDLEQAEAALGQRLAERNDLRARIDADVRNAFYDLQTAANQVKVADSNREVARETLTLSRQRLDEGVSDVVEVVQAQEAVAIAEQDYISAVFAHNLAKVSFARAIGRAEENVFQFLRLP